ncbi:phage holin family protein [Glaesserella parasuis]|nr:phage holin family protein [Glaesserella parasuis]MDE3980312.1 phage holin family protein [Glaesserella parasuis]
MGLIKMDRNDNTSLLGAVVTVLTSLNLPDWGVIMGILFGLFTLLMNWYYKDREIKLKEKALERYKINLKDILDDEQKS